MIPLILLTFYLVARKLRIYVFIKFRDDLSQVSVIMTTTISIKHYLFNLYCIVN